MEREKYTDEQMAIDRRMASTMLDRIDELAQRLKAGCDPTSFAASEIDRGMGRMRRLVAILLSHAVDINEADKLPASEDPREHARRGFTIVRLTDNEGGGDGQQR